MNPIEKLTELFRQFPGIGPRQAKRFVYFLLTRQNDYVAELAGNIKNIRSEISHCPSCFRFFTKDNDPKGLCSICRSDRAKDLLMIVSTDIDFENIEKTGCYQGYYFILGGTVPILEKSPERRIRQKELLEKVEEKSKAGLSEIIIALSYNPEGENTLRYLQNILDPLAKKYSFKISVLGRGLSTGTELEYSDADTIKNALQNRH